MQNEPSIALFPCCNPKKTLSMIAGHQEKTAAQFFAQQQKPLRNFLRRHSDYDSAARIGTAPVSILLIIFCILPENEPIGKTRNNNVSSTTEKMFFEVVLWFASYHICAKIQVVEVGFSTTFHAILRTPSCTQARRNQTSAQMINFAV